MGYVNDDRMKELWERIKTVFARKEEIPDIPDIKQPIADTLDAAKDYTDAAYQQSTGYTDQKIAELIGGAPSTMDTLKEVADAMQANKTVVDALDEAIGKKAEAVEVDAHTGNKTIHITASERTAWNNKLDKTGDASNVTNTFTAASSLTALTSKEKLSVSLGKIAKAVSTLISHISAMATASTAGHVKVDTALSTTSTNPVQNKAVNAALSQIQKSFQDGCDTLYGTCVECGVTPSVKTPSAIAAAIQLIQINAVTSGKSSIKISTYTVNDKLAINSYFKMLIPELPDNTRRVIGYFIINDAVSAGTGSARMSTDLPFSIINGVTEHYVEMYMHPSNGTKIHCNSGPISVTEEAVEVKGIGSRRLITVSTQVFTKETYFDANGNWDALSWQNIYIKGYWNSATATRDRKVIVIYEEE